MPTVNFNMVDCPAGPVAPSMLPPAPSPDDEIALKFMHAQSLGSPEHWCSSSLPVPTFSRSEDSVLEKANVAGKLPSHEGSQVCGALAQTQEVNFNELVECEEQDPQLSSPRKFSNQWWLDRGYRGASLVVESLSMRPHLPEIGDLPFWAFTVFLVLLFSFAVITDALLILVDIQAELQGRSIFPSFLKYVNYIWISLQGFLFLDLLCTYLRYYRRRLLRSKPRRRRHVIGSSSFHQPASWSVLTRVLGIQLTPRTYLLLLALLLPVNVLVFYLHIGRPFFTESVLDIAAVNQLLDPVHWPQGGGLHVAVNTGEVTLLASGDLLAKITLDQCYEPGGSEFRILSRLRREAMPKQAYCESTIGYIIALWRRKLGSPDWQCDEDYWEELFDFTVRIFGALAGVIADKQLDRAGGGFLQDMTDLFDMYMLTFVDVTQMHEGRDLLTGKHGFFFLSFPYHHCVLLWIGAAYITLFFRALSALGFRPLSWLLTRWSFVNKVFSIDEVTALVVTMSSLLFIDLPFFVLRWIAWFYYSVPISVLAVKNVFGICSDLHELGLAPGLKVGARPHGFTKCFCKSRLDHPNADEAEVVQSGNSM